MASEALAHHGPSVIRPGFSPLPRLLGGASVPDEPELSLLFPKKSAAPNGIPALFVDTKEQPGKVLLRFDTVVLNLGGALDIYSPDDGKTVYQVIWPGGHPPGDDLPDPFKAPGNLQFQTNITPDGARMKFVPGGGHNHFHLQRVATYRLVLANGKIRKSSKVGFCLLDTWGNEGGYGYFRISQERNFCQHGNPEAVFTRMGISPGVGDYYNAQLADQWVDVTGVRPGRHTIAGTVNAAGVLIETKPGNNSASAKRKIPGALAKGQKLGVPVNRSTVIELKGKVIGASIRSRKNAKCDLFKAKCYVRAAPKRLKFKIFSQPPSGKVKLLSMDRLTARIRYTPDRGFEGRDSFRFTVTDSRGLRSAPATVRLRVNE